MAVLPTNYLDDILAASMGGKRRFRITHEDGSTEEVTLEDVSEYEQVGSPFGSGDVNKTNQAVNEKLDSADVVDPALATVLGFAADAKLTGDALSELTKNNLKIKFVSLATQPLAGSGEHAIDITSLKTEVTDMKEYKGFIPFSIASTMTWQTYGLFLNQTYDNIIIRTIGTHEQQYQIYGYMLYT